MKLQQHKGGIAEVDAGKDWTRLWEGIQNLTILDNIFMQKVLEDPACVKCLLDVILEKDLTIEKNEVEKVINGLSGKGVRIDVYAMDNENTRYAIEIQRENAGAKPKRGRRNSAYMDASYDNPGEYGEDLPEMYVIFITEHDPLGGGLPLYHIERVIQESGKPYGDGAHIIYVNTSIQDETPLGRLMHDLRAKSAEDMYYQALASRVGHLKKYATEGKKMNAEWDELVRNIAMTNREEGRQEGREEGRQEGELKLLFKLTLEGMLDTMKAAAISELGQDTFTKRLEEYKKTGQVLLS